MSLTTDIMSPVTTGGMIYPSLHNMIIQTIMPNIVARQFLTQISMTTGNAITFAKQSGSPGAVADEIGEGAEIPLDVTSYSQVVVVPKKVGQGLIITRETIEQYKKTFVLDNRFPVTSSSRPTNPKGFNRCKQGG